MLDKILLDIYMFGFKDELSDNDKKIDYKKLFDVAFDFGKVDAIIGDDIESNDYQTEEDILKRIKHFNK